MDPYEDSPARAQKRKAAIFVGIAAVLWSLDGFIRYPTSHGLRVHQLVFLEHLVGLAFMLPFLFFRSKSVVIRELGKLRWSHVVAVLGIAAIGSIAGNTLYTRSIRAVGPATGSLFQVIQPFAVLGLAWLILKERQAGRYFPVAIWILLNALLIAFPDVSLGFEGGEGQYGAGLLFGAGAVFAWSLSTVSGKWMLRDFSPETVVFLRWFTAIVITGMFTAISDAPFPLDALLDPEFFPRLILLSVVSGAFSFYLYYRGLKDLPASFVTFIEVIYPILGIFYPIITTRASIGTLQLFGATTIFLTVLFLVYFEIRLTPKDSRPN